MLTPETPYYARLPGGATAFCMLRDVFVPPMGGGEDDEVQLRLYANTFYDGFGAIGRYEDLGHDRHVVHPRGGGEDFLFVPATHALMEREVEDHPWLLFWQEMAEDDEELVTVLRDALRPALDRTVQSLL